MFTAAIMTPKTYGLEKALFKCETQKMALGTGVNYACYFWLGLFLVI